ncbi:MAG: AAA family ATPase [Methanomassiliicoccales archaeon]|nr:MAG: AAA family ATPase [Methanomassiliicoccales archaeon]
MRKRNVVLVYAVVQLLPFLIFSQGAAAVWQDTVFENNLFLDFDPASPDNLEPVNVSITSINSSQPLSSAFLFCNFTRDGEFTEGGYTFSFSDSSYTKMYCMIPDIQNTGGTVVNFHVVAYDEINSPITSNEHQYTVAKNGSWPYSTFDENIQVTYHPQAPEAYQEVGITIQSRHSNVPISSAEITWEIETPNQIPRYGMALFNAINPTTLNVTIPGYEGESNVTFTITAYDQYYSPMISQEFLYLVGSSDVTYIYDMVIEVIDDYLKKPASGASVTIRNESGIVHTGVTTSQGLLMTPVMFHSGDYTIEVEYNSNTQTKEISIPYENNNQITFSFEAQAKVVSEFVEFPHWYDYAGIIGALIIPLLFCWIFYKKQRERLLAITEKKKTFGRSVEDEKKTLKTMFWDAFSRETKQPKVLTPIAFFALGIFGAVFIPFYPWWAIIIVASFIGVVSYKFPFSALLLLCVFITGSAAYQTPEFGLVFLVFSLVVMLCSFYDWRFGYLVFLMIFLSRFGVSFMVPIFAAMVFSTFLAISVTLCAGVFLVLLVSASDYQVIGLIAGAEHSTAFMIFEKPVVENFTPGTFASVMSEIAAASGDTIGSVLAEGFATSMLPFFILAFWCFGIFLLSYLVDENKRLSFTTFKEWFLYPTKTGRSLKIIFSSICIIVFSSFAVIFQFGYLNNPDILGTVMLALLFIGVGAAIYTSAVSCLIVREMFREYFTSKIGVAAVGARVSEMSDLGKTTFDQVGGLEDVKMDIKESVLVPLLRPDIAEQFGVEPAKGILLFGAPGCGKTLTMKALATELNIEMFTVKCGDLMSKWYGESETRMMTLFKTAKDRKPAIIFFDEIEAVAKRRDLYSADDVTPRLLSIMLSELDGMDKSTGVIIVGSTNKPELVDPALLRPGRFDKIMYIPPPDYSERIDILKVHMTGKPLEGKINLEELAKRTEGYSGADLANLVKEAATNAMRRSMQTQKITAITQKDFLDILPKIKPSISLTMKEEYERVKMRYERKVHDVCRSEQKAVVTMETVAGMEDVKKQLMESVILPLTKRKLVEKFKLRTGRAILLHSPPGCGKTYLMRAMANQYNIPFQEVTGSELKNAISADGTLALKGLWAQVRDMAPAILFISDIDSIASQKNIEEDGGNKANSVFLSMLDNIQPTDKVVVVASSENPDALDPSLFIRGRFDKKISLPPPDSEARKKIFKQNLKDVPKIGKIDLDVLASSTQGFSGEDVFAVVEDAKLLALSGEEIFSSAKKGPKVQLGVKMEDLMKAIKKTKPSVFEWEKRLSEAQEAAKPPPPPPETPISKPISEPVKVKPPASEPPKPPPPPPEIIPSAEDIAMMTIAQLEEACRQFGLKPYGKKAVLKERLGDYLNKNNGGS